MRDSSQLPAIEKRKKPDKQKRKANPVAPRVMAAAARDRALFVAPAEHIQALAAAGAWPAVCAANRINALACIKCGPSD